MQPVKYPTGVYFPLGEVGKSKLCCRDPLFFKTLWRRSWVTRANGYFLLFSWLFGCLNMHLFHSPLPHLFLVLIWFFSPIRSQWYNTPIMFIPSRHWSPTAMNTSPLARLPLTSRRKFLTQRQVSATNSNLQMHLLKLQESSAIQRCWVMTCFDGVYCSNMGIEVVTGEVCHFWCHW